MKLSSNFKRAIGRLPASRDIAEPQAPGTWLRRLAAGRAGSVSLPVFLFLFTPHLHAADPADPSVKIREQLRAVTLQLRTAQTESANAQAAAAAAEQKSTDLTAKVADLEKKGAVLAKQTTADKQAAAQSIASLEAKVADRDKSLATHKEAVAKWKDGYQKAAAVANDKEQQRAQLAAELTTAKNTIADRERKNISLFNTANEILDRFQNYALGKALAAREPFIGTTRVKVENLVQGYHDRILDHRIQAPAKKP